MDGISNNKLGTECCFCKKSIEPNKIDPCNISILAQWDKPKTEQVDINFWCHFDCFKAKLHKDMQGYFLKDYFIPDDEK